jgi:hypothetical protein
MNSDGQKKGQSADSARSRRAQLGSAIAVGISLMALVVGFYQARIAERQAHASVWPYLTIGYNLYDRGENRGFTWTVDNSGLGPALIQSVVVSLDGKPVRRWEDVTAVLGLKKDFEHTTSSVRGRVLPPNSNRDTTIQAIRVFALPDAEAFWKARERLQMDVCYCSVYQECWVAHWLKQKVDPVSKCSGAATPEFEQ